MAQIDRFIEALHRLDADRLELVPGARVVLAVNGGRRPVTSQPATEQQIDALLGEIMPEGPGSSGSGDGGEFVYQAPSGPVRVNVSGAGSPRRVLIWPTDKKGGAQPGDPDPRALEPRAEKVSGSVERRGTGTAAPPSTGEAPAAAVDESRARARIDALFRRMVEEGCSDLHVSTGVQPMFRKDGEIVPAGDEVLSAEAARTMLFSITPPHKREEFEQLHDCDFAYEISGVARYRCNLFLDRKGVGGVFRVIPANIRTVEDLGLGKEIIDLCKLPRGLVLVTGPTGSGKSTTLAAMIDYVNQTRSDHIVTIEDPIEFVHPNKKCLINQREVGVHTRGFKVALRAALREDPDVVLVGEMRDLETVAIAIETAETGHLVFGTLHTRTAASTVDRIIDQFPAEQQSQIRTMLAESLKGVISQALLKAKGGGRVAAMEFLLVTTAVSNLIREGKTYQIPSIMQTSRGKGMQTLNDAFLQLVQSGKVEAEVAYGAAVDKAELKALFGRNGIAFSSGPMTG